MKRRGLAIAMAALLAVLLAVGACLPGAQPVLRARPRSPRTSPSATGIYPGDEVRVSGVKVGTIDSIDPDGTQAKITMNVDHDVPIPADAKAVIVAQNLVAARYVQLTPAYRHNSGPKMADGAVIRWTAPRFRSSGTKSRTNSCAWPPISGPKATCRPPRWASSSTAPPTRSTATATSCGRPWPQLSGVGRILADGSGNIVDIIKNLQTFVTTLRDSNTQIVQFQNRLATLTSVLNDNRSDLDGAIADLSVAVGEVQRFIAGPGTRPRSRSSGWPTSRRTWWTTRRRWRTSCTSRRTAFANGYNIYNPDTGDFGGGFALPNFSNRWGSSAARSAPWRTPPHRRRRSCARSTSARRCGC